MKSDTRIALRHTKHMTKTISVRIDESLLRAVDIASGGEQGRRSEIVRGALKLWLGQRALAQKVHRHQEGYERQPIMDDEFTPILKAQTWPK